MEGMKWISVHKTVSKKDTYVNLWVDDINEAAKDNDEIKHIPGVPKVILQTVQKVKQRVISY